MTDEPFGPIAIDLKLGHLEVLPGEASKLFVWVRLPRHRAATKVFLQFSRKLITDGIQFAAPWSPTANLHGHWPNAYARRFDGHRGDQDDVDWGVADTHTCLLDVIQSKEAWLNAGFDGKGLEEDNTELLLEWSTVLHVDKAAGLGENLQVTLTVYTFGIDEPEHRSTQIVVGKEQKLSEPVDFLVGPRVILTASNHIILHGLSTHPLSDVKKQYPSLQFSYSVGGGVEQAIDSKLIHLSEGDRSFSVQLPEAAFPGGGQDGLTVKTYRSIRVHIRYTDNNGKVHSYPSQSLTVIIDNREPVFVNPKLSVSQAEDGTHFVVKGQVQGPDASPFTGASLAVHDNPVTDVAICWTGDIAAPAWSQPNSVAGKPNLWVFTLSERVANIKGVLNPVLIAKTQAGVQQAQYLTFPDLTELVTVAVQVKDSPAPVKDSSLPVKFSWPKDKDSDTHTVTIRRGQGFEIELSITACVGISRMNVAVELRNNKPIMPGSPEARTPISRDPQKPVTVLPGLPKDEENRRLHAWNGGSSKQMLSLREFTRDTPPYTVNLPLLMARDADAGSSWEIELQFTDPITNQSTFTDQVCSIKVNVS